MDTEKNGEMNEDKEFSEKLRSVPYCMACRDVCMNEQCERCHRETVRAWGTLADFKRVAHVMLNGGKQSEWQQMLESMTEKPQQ